jgi:predicted enzyme related to lactoylglutathione lyase
MDMGAMGTYQLIADGDDQFGAMFNSPHIPQPAWLFYFNVPAIDAAADRIKAAGGQVIMGPHEVPGGQWIVNGVDPQGAMFALVAPGR